MEKLRVTESFAEFFDSAMDISRYNIYLSDHLSVDGGTETHHTVGGRMLGADIDDIFIFPEHFLWILLHISITVESESAGIVLVHLILKTDRIQAGAGVIVLAERIAHPVIAEEEAAHVGMVYEFDSEHVVDLTLLKICHAPEIADGVDVSVFAVRAHHLDGEHFPRTRSTGEVIDHADALFPVDTHNSREDVERKFIFQSGSKIMPVLFRHIHQQAVALLELRGGIYL